MASSSIPQTWLVERLPTATDRGYNKRRSKFSDASHSGNWTLVFSILDDAHKRYHESWIDCPTSTDGWTALHHAAYKGAPVSTVTRLINMGASRKRSHSSDHSQPGAPLIIYAI
jgi:ankyrin repeat protein